MSIFTEHFFTDTVNVYRQRKKTVGDLAYFATPVITALPCALQATENVDKLQGAMGLKKEDNIFTLDIRGQDVIKITTLGHPELNEYYEVMGDPKDRPSKFSSQLGYAKAYINKITTPDFIASGS